MGRWRIVGALCLVMAVSGCGVARPATPSMTLVKAVVAPGPSVTVPVGVNRLGRSIDLTPAGGVSSWPVAAIGGDRILVAYVAGGKLVARLGTVAGTLGPAQTLAVGNEVPSGDLVIELVAGVGPDGTAAVAWQPNVEQTDHGRVYVATAPPSGAFGAAHLVDGREFSSTLDGIAVDRDGRVVVAWDRPNRSGCCTVTSTSVRYAIGDPGASFTAPRTLGETDSQQPYGIGHGAGQVLGTSDGGVVLSAEGDADGHTDRFARLDPHRLALDTFAGPQIQPVLAGVEAGSGAGGFGVAFLGDAQTNTPGPDPTAFGVVRRAADGTWGSTQFARVSGSFDGPLVAFPADGASVVAWIAESDRPNTPSRVMVASGSAGQPFDTPTAIASKPVFSVDGDQFEMASFAGDTALAWAQPVHGGRVLKIALRSPDRGFSAPTTVGQLGSDSGISLASGGDRLALAWLDDLHVRLALARASS